MIVKTLVEVGRVRFFIEPEPKDGFNHFDSASLASLEFYSEVPAECKASPHSDHIALSALLAVAPFVNERLLLDVPLSHRFISACTHFNFDVSTIDSNVVDPYECGDGKPALAFSGGVDSTAALALMPENTISVFLDRPLNRGKSLYKKEAAQYAVEHLKELGRTTFLLECDVEYVRKPVGFPVDTEMDLPSTAAIPTLLAANGLGIDAVAFGVIAESAYKIGHDKFADFSSSDHYVIWGSLFQAAGVPYMPVTAGISEVGTSTICLRSPIGYVAQSCMRGDVQKPCMNCMKCFRKTLLEKAILREKISDVDLASLLRSKEVIRNLEKTPIKHENVFKYILGRDIGSSEFVEEFKCRVLGDDDSQISYEWLEKWYSPSIELVPHKYREDVENKINSYLSMMTEMEVELVRSWDQRAEIESAEIKARAGRFNEYLRCAKTGNRAAVACVKESHANTFFGFSSTGRTYGFMRKVKRKLKSWKARLMGGCSKRNMPNPREKEIERPNLQELEWLVEAGKDLELREQLGLADPKTARALELAHANLLLKEKSIDGWCQRTNKYLEQFDLSPLSFNTAAKGTQFNQLTSSGGVQISGGQKVSVIVPAFNAERTIRISVESLQAQTYSNIEIVVVDDCSSDSTINILEGYAATDDRIKIVGASENQGPYCSKNLALKHCSGDYITGHDADDWAHPQRIEKQLAFMVANPGVQVGIASMLRVSEDCRFTKLSKVSDHSYDGALRTAMISAFFTKEAIKEQLGGWDSVRFAGDSEMIGRAKVIFGPRLKYFPMMTMICLDNPQGLTNDPKNGVNTASGMSESRKVYSANYQSFHKRIAADHSLAKYNFPMETRPFPAPEECTVP